MASMKVRRSLSGLVVLALFSCQPGDAQVSENIIFKDNLGHVLTQTDLVATTGQVNYEIMNNHPINTAAKQLHEGDLIFSTATTTANVELAKFALKSITENK